MLAQTPTDLGPIIEQGGLAGGLAIALGLALIAVAYLAREVRLERAATGRERDDNKKLVDALMALTRDCERALDRNTEVFTEIVRRAL